MQRRAFISAVTGGLLAAPLAAKAQPAKVISRIGFLDLQPAAAPVSPARQGFVQGLADLGYVEGHNVVFVRRWAEGREDRLPDLAAELLALNVHMIASSSTEAIIATRNLSKTIPIVMITISDPIGNGLGASFARPGSNVTMAKERDGGLIVQQTAAFNPHIPQMAELALKHRLPTVHSNGVFAKSGGLLAYGPNIFTLGYRAATYADKILKGAKPADLPVEQPTTFELVINLKTAKALSLTIPPSLLARADQVIE